MTVLVGVSVKGSSIGGVIHQPYYNYTSGTTEMGRTLWGLIGVGVGGFVPKEPPRGTLILTTTRSHSDELVVRTLDSLEADEIVRAGGAGYKVLLLMEGKAHAYVFASKGCKKWDTCAPEAILKAIGGKLTDVHGRDYSYDKGVKYPNAGGVFATVKGLNHAALLAKIPQDVKDVLH